MDFTSSLAPKRPVEEALAYLDVDGDLVIKGNADSVYPICLTENGHAIIDIDWDPEELGRIFFFPGDQVTITF